jgi:hypothetical protein
MVKFSRHKVKTTLKIIFAAILHNIAAALLG